MRRTLALFFFLFLVNAGASALAIDDVKHIRVIWHENPARDAIVAWSSDKLCKKATLYLDTESRAGDLKAYKFKLKAKRKWYTGTTDARQSVVLEGLNPNSKYYFTIVNDKKKSKEYYFKTAPADGSQNFSLLFGGDSRSDRGDRQQVNGMIKKMVDENPNLLALVHGGDFIANGMSWKQWKAWLDDLQLKYGKDGRVLAIVPTRGNHEYFSPLFNDVFQRPGKKIYKNYFTTKLGGLSIITLNTNTSFSGKQKRWLESELKTSSEDSRWVFTNYHRPAYPAVKKPGKALKHWVPLFEKYHIDLAFESDGHVLKKTVPIYAGKKDMEKGIIYIGEGGMGVKQRVPSKTEEWYLQSPGYAESHHHVIKVDVSSTQLDVSVHLLNGTVFDNFTLSPKKRN